MDAAAHATEAPAGAPAARDRSDGDSPLLALLPHVLRLFRREPALGITVAYLFVALAGVSYASSFYRQFGIPVLSLMEIGDFLVAGIQQPAALLLVLSTLPLCWLIDRWNARVFARERAAHVRLGALAQPGRWQRLRLRYLAWRIRPAARNRVLQVAYLLGVALYGWLFVSLYAELRAHRVKHGTDAGFAVWLNGSSEPLAASSSRAWTYLGATGNYVFVYDRAAARAEVLPVTALARLQPLAPAQESASAAVVPGR